jgi:hypothetical protein
MLLVTLATLIAFSSAAEARATPFQPTLTPKLTLGKIVPKVKFEPKAKLGKTGAQVKLDAVLSFAGKSKRISIFSMGLKKKGKSVRVNRKVGKLKVSLTVSWSGEREIVIKGSARYLKFKVPVPKLRLKV